MTNRSIAILAALLIASPAAAGVKEGVEKWQAGDHKGAVVEWLPYAAKGDPDALFNLGQAYKLGRGVPMDKAKAEDFYRRAADKGHAPAQSNLGIVLAQRGAKPEAAKLWQQAAAKGEPRAQYMLGVLHFNGDTVEKNWPLAYAYMLKANEAGLPQAARAMTTMGSNLAEADRTRGKELAAAMGSANRLATSGKPVTTSQRVAGDAPAPVAVKAKLPEPMTPIRAASPAKASPRPIVAAATVPQPAHGASDGGWRVQLGAFSQEARARDAWALLKREQAGLVGGIDAHFVPSGSVTRLQIGSFGNADAANALCQKLKVAGRPCFVVEAN